MSDLTEQVDEIQGLVDDHESRVSSTESSLDEHENRIGSVESTIGDGATIGQLDFPLSADSQARIREVFPTGTFLLTGNAVTVTDANVSPNSIIMFSRINGGTVGNNIYAVAGSGTITFNSMGGNDGGTFTYVVFN